MKAFIIFTIAFIIFASAAQAQTDSVTTGLKLVDDFAKEARTLSSSLGSKTLSSKLSSSIAEKSDKAVKEINSIKWTEKPSRRRFKMVLRLVDAYTSGVIQEFGGAGDADIQGQDKKALLSGVERLSGMKEKMLLELNETIKNEPFVKKPVKPAPLLERQPNEEGPKGEKGIWYR